MRKIPIFKKISEYEYEITGWRRMKKEDVRKYFWGITIKGIGSKREKGNYCQRCGIATTNLKKYLGYDVCIDCYNKKKEGQKTTPDLEDLKRFKIKI